MYLFFDTETGGLTPQHSLLTVSCIVVDDKFNIIPVGNPLQTDDGRTGLYLKIKHDEYALTSGALSVNKIDLVEHDKQSTPLPAARTILRAFLDDGLRVSNKKRFVPAGHNVAFDVKFLQAYLLTPEEWDRYFTYPALDTAAIARFLSAAGMHAGGYSLGKLRDKFIPHTSGAELHDAEIDNLTAIELAKKFVSLMSQ
jgi:DNA polymerase III epsilon subunit-like protein